MTADDRPPPRRALVVKPIFTYPLAVRHRQTSWRNWGGIETRRDVDEEIARIRGEIDGLRRAADFPLEFLPPASIRRIEELEPHRADIARADAILLHAAGDGGGDLMASVNPIDALGKDLVFFVRNKVGPVYYWYEGAMARFVQQHTDRRGARSADYDDVVVDRMDEVLWRLRALAGLRSTVGSRIVAIGGPGAWGRDAEGAEAVADRVRSRWKIDIRSVPTDDLAARVRSAAADRAAVERARGEADEYLRRPGTVLETGRAAVDGAFLLAGVLRDLLAEAGCRAVTIRECAGAIPAAAGTTPCLALSVLNDAGYLAFCESDFVAIPAGLLLANISGRPALLADPTFPYAGRLALAHCTAPRRLDGKSLEPARILTHFESDSGAAPRVEMRVGQALACLVPDFAGERWAAVRATVAGNPSLAMCRSQIEVRFAGDGPSLAGRLPGFHWVAAYGDWMRELGYVLRRVPVRLEVLA